MRSMRKLQRLVINITPELLERFWSKVDRSGGPDACWPWTGGLGPGGYGTIKIDGRMIPAHRVAFALEHGAVETDTYVLHHCDNPPCCNPACLFPGTQADNMEDCAQKDRTPFGDRSPARRLTEADVIEARRLFAEGASFPSLRKRYGVSHNTIYSAVTGLTWRRLPGAVQTRGFARKLTDSDVVEMRRLYATGGMLMSDLAAQFGMSKEAAGDAITGRAYAHVPGAVPRAHLRGRHRRKEVVLLAS